MVLSNLGALLAQAAFRRGRRRFRRQPSLPGGGTRSNVYILTNLGALANDRATRGQASSRALTLPVRWAIRQIARWRQTWLLFGKAALARHQVPALAGPGDRP
jgi:hypothetical protein